MSELEIVKQLFGYGAGGLVAALAFVIYIQSSRTIAMMQGNHDKLVGQQQERLEALTKHAIDLENQMHNDWIGVSRVNAEHYTRMHQDWVNTTERVTQAINRMADILIKLETLAGIKDG